MPKVDDDARNKCKRAPDPECAIFEPQNMMSLQWPQ